MTVVELFAKMGLKVDEASFRKGEAAIGGMSAMLAGFGLSLGAARGAIEALVASTAAHGNAAAKAAQRVGVSVQALQELTEAADDVQIAAGSVESGLKFAGKNAYEASKGSKEAAESFRDLGVSYRDGSGDLKRSDAIMTEVADRFSAMEDGPAKTALAMRLFGRSGGELIPLLNKGSRGIAEMREEAVRLGLVMSKDNVDASVDYTEALDGLEDSIKGLKLTIGSSLLKGSAEFLRTLTKWVQENRKLVATKVLDFVRQFGIAVRRAKQFLDPMISAVTWLVSQSWAWKLALGALAVVIGIQLGAAIRSAVLGLVSMAASIAGVTAAQIGAAAVSMAAALAWALGFAIVALAIEDLYTMMEGGESVASDFTKWLDRVLKINPNDSPLVKGLKGLLQILTDLQSAFNTLTSSRAWARVGVSILDAGFDERGKKAFGIDKLNAEYFGPTGGRASGYPASAPMLGSSHVSTAAPSSISMSAHGPISVTVTPPPGTNPEEWGEKIGDAIDERLRSILDPAYEAVVN